MKLTSEDGKSPAIIDRSLTLELVRVTERAELVILVLERVRIDASDPDPALSGECRQAGEIVDRIPGDMERDRLCDPGVAGDRGRVFDLLEGVARYPGLREDAESCSGIDEPPGGNLDRKVFHGPADAVELGSGASARDRSAIRHAITSAWAARITRGGRPHRAADGIPSPDPSVGR